MHVRHVSIHGQRIAYRTAGHGPVVVLLHGMAGDSATWRHVLPGLAAGCTVVAPDLLGHGQSAMPRTEYAVGAHANVVRDLLATLGHTRATFVGQSFGGGVAMQLAYQYPESCERLVLVSSGGLGREVHPLLRALSAPGAEAVLALACTPWLRDAGAGLARWLGDLGVRAAPVAEELWRSYATLTDAHARRAFFRTLRAVIDPRGQTVSAIDRLYLAAHVPTLIVWGRRDTLIPVSHATAAHAAIPGSRLVVFENAGHFPHCEAPAAFVDALRAFLETTAPACVPETQWRTLLRDRALAS